MARNEHNKAVKVRLLMYLRGRLSSRRMTFRGCMSVDPVSAASMSLYLALCSVAGRAWSGGSFSKRSVVEKRSRENVSGIQKSSTETI
jgi:hypothetical protein